MKKAKLTSEQIADRIVKELNDSGLNPNEMLQVIRLAQIKYKRMKELKNS